ncbi:MAG: hypothetical protein AAFP02_05350 [Bacteroidota bacterium]
MKVHSILRTLLGAGLLLSLSACEYFAIPDYSNIEPQVELAIPELISNDSLLLTATILDEGLQEVEYTGFFFNRTGSYKRNGRRQIEENQIDAPREEGANQFTTVLTQFAPGDTVYFFAFAGAEDSYYGVSEAVEYVVPSFLAPEVPCTLPEDELFHNGIAEAVDNCDYRKSGYVFGESAIFVDVYFRYSVEFYFQGPPPEQPYSGTYTTITYNGIDNADRFDVYAKVDYSWTDYTIDPGAKVYVTSYADGRFEVEFCELTYQVGNSTVSLSGHAWGK